MAFTTMQGGDAAARGGGQVGRSPPRLEARAKVTGQAEYTHTMRLPGMLHGKIFRSTVAHGRIKSIDTSAAKEVPGVYRVVTSEDVRKVIPEPYYGPAFHDQPILAIDKVHYVGEPVAVVLAADLHVAEEAAQLIVAEYEELPAIFDEVEAAENNDPGAPGAQARRHLRRSQAPQGPQGHQYRARFQAAGAAMSTRPSPTPPRSSSTPSARRRCCISPLEPFASIGELERDGRNDLQRVAGSVLRAHRNRPAARLAGEPRPRQGALSRRRLRRQALYQAGGAGDRALA